LNLLSSRGGPTGCLAQQKTWKAEKRAKLSARRIKRRGATERNQKLIEEKTKRKLRLASHQSKVSNGSDSIENPLLGGNVQNGGGGDGYFKYGF